MKRPVYLDYQASTPLDPLVFEAMRPLLEEGYGNPHSEHAHGWEAAQAIEQAASETARLHFPYRQTAHQVRRRGDC